MNPIGRYVKKAVDSPQLLRHGRARQVLTRWVEVVGPALAERSWPDRYDDGTVWVAVRGSAWAQELRMRHEEILERLQGLTDDPSLFTRVRFGVRKLPTERAIPVVEPPAPAKPPKPTPKDVRGLTIRQIMALYGVPGAEDPPEPSRD